MKSASYRHHFLPVFYTKRWAKSDGRVCEFSRPFKRIVKPKRVHPAAMGYLDGLYEIKGLRTELGDQFERLFLKPVDSTAADVLHLLEREGADREWTSQHRSAWTRFILTLVMRMPQDIEDLKAMMAEDWSKPDAVMADKYSAARGPADPDTIQEWLALNAPNLVENSSFPIAVSMMNHEKIGEDINRFAWFLRSTNDAKRELLTSDRPVVHTDSLGGKQVALVLPIGPRSLFVATRERSLGQRIVQASSDELTTRLMATSSPGRIDTS